MSHKKSAKNVTPDTDLAAWCAVLSQSTVKPEVVPPGWFTVRQLATKWGRSECTTGERVKRLFRAGQIERKEFIIKLDQIVRPTPHYRLK
jgi:predicted transcriptional regulator